MIGYGWDRGEDLGWSRRSEESGIRVKILMTSGFIIGMKVTRNLRETAIFTEQKRKKRSY